MSHQTRTQRLKHAQDRLRLLQQEQVRARTAYEAIAIGYEVKLSIGTIREAAHATSTQRKQVRERWLSATHKVAQQERRIARLGG